MNSKTLSHEELAEAFKRNQILISEEELGLLMLDYDTTGAAKAFELEMFESDFAEWQTQEYKDSMYGGRRRKEYDAYDTHFSSVGRSTSAAVPEAYRPMLKDIVDAIERRHSGTLQWFRSHCYHTTDANVLSAKEFVNAIEALNILA